jgi:phage-related protein
MWEASSCRHLGQIPHPAHAKFVICDYTFEKAWQFISALIKGGPAALWEQIKEFLGSLKEMVTKAIQDWIVEGVIKAAIKKLILMFNPVGAIIGAIMAIYDTVMFFIERINQILAFVEAIINSVYKIATGDISSAANWIENALAKAIPVIIGFLARLLGLTGIAEKIKETIKKIQDTVDKLIDKIVKGIGKLFGKGKAEEKGTGDLQP